LASASARSWDRGVGLLAIGSCPWAESVAASTNAAVKKETTLIRKLHSQMQFKTMAVAQT
jgi:hypothetical protein